MASARGGWQDWLSRRIHGSGADRRQLRRWPVALLSTLCAAVLWVVVNLNEEHVTRVAVPVEAVNRPSDRALKQPLPKLVRLLVRGRGWSLARMKFSPPVWRIDLSGRRESYTIATNRAPGAYVDLPRDVTAQVVSPETIPIIFDDLVTRRLPVSLRLTIKTAQGFQIIGPTTVEPESVTVTGAATTLSALSSWPTDAVTLADQRKDLDEEIALDNPNPGLIHLSSPSVTVRADVQEITEDRRPAIAIVVTGVPGGKQVVLSPPRLAVLLRGGVDDLAKLPDDSISIHLSYDAVMADTLGVLRPTVRVPLGIELVRVEPDRVQYLVRSR